MVTEPKLPGVKEEEARTKEKAGAGRTEEPLRKSTGSSETGSEGGEEDGWGARALHVAG